MTDVSCWHPPHCRMMVTLFAFTIHDDYWFRNIQWFMAWRTFYWLGATESFLGMDSCGHLIFGHTGRIYWWNSEQRNSHEGNGRTGKIRREPPLAVTGAKEQRRHQRADEGKKKGKKGVSMVCAGELRRRSRPRRELNLHPSGLHNLSTHRVKTRAPYSGE